MIDVDCCGIDVNDVILYNNIIYINLFSWFISL